jgi:hypothetical protein
VIARGKAGGLPFPVLIMSGDVDLVGVEVAQKIAGDELVAQLPDLRVIKGEGFLNCSR